MIRNIVHYSGQVQGVGFRMRVQRLALGFRVTGYVMNLPDGRVRLVAEGDAAEVRGLVAAVGKEMAEYIARADVDRSVATGEFSEFRIRY
jgi:acylphosphatase